MKVFELRNFAIVLAASAALYSFTQALPRTSKESDGASTRSENARTAKVRLTRKSDAYWQVTVNNPPFNSIGPGELRELNEILDQVEADPKVKFVVFD